MCITEHDVNPYHCKRVHTGPIS